jgi:RNA polymerase sigma-70 factor, ECF subfamily
VSLGPHDQAASPACAQRANDAVTAPHVEADPGVDQRWSLDMVAAQNGDGAAYARLLHGILPFLRAVIRRQHVPHDQIDDVVQDALLSIHRVRHTYDPSRPLSPWLAAIARRRALDSRRQRARVETAEVAAPELLATLPDPSADTQVERDDEHGWLRSAVGTLTPKQRVAVELVKLRGFSVAEAASTSGQSPGAIKVNVHRALQALRALYKGG